MLSQLLKASLWFLAALVPPQRQHLDVERMLILSLALPTDSHRFQKLSKVAPDYLLKLPYSDKLLLRSDRPALLCGLSLILSGCDKNHGVWGFGPFVVHETLEGPEDRAASLCPRG